VFGFLASADRVSQMIHDPNFLRMRTSAAISIKILLLIGSFSLSFCNHAMLRSTSVAVDDRLAAASAVQLAVQLYEQGSH